MQMTWEIIRQHYAARLAVARRQGLTQQTVATVGGLSGQNAISKLLANRNLGPSVETFAKAVTGLGLTLSAFFAELESRGSTSDAQTVVAAALPDPDPIEQAHMAIEAARCEVLDHRYQTDELLERLERVEHALYASGRDEGSPSKSRLRRPSHGADRRRRPRGAA